MAVRAACKSKAVEAVVVPAVVSVVSAACLFSGWLHENAIAAISKQKRFLLIKKGDSTALAAHYSSDAVLLLDNSEPQSGPGILATWGGAIRSGMKELRLTTTDLVGNADLLAETGNYEMVGANNKMMDKGKYVVVWKQEGGTWKIYRDIANSNLPAQP